ncbi:MAG: glutathionylspermidine synthase, partial [Thiothrix sp.]
MLQTEIVKPLSNSLMEELGMNWHTDSDGTAYILNEIIPVT